MTEKKKMFTSSTVFYVFTVVWIGAFIVLNALPFVSRFEPFAYSTYVSARVVGLVVILVLTGFALARAYSYSGPTETPWYRDGFLLAAIFFWGLFPPTWFFTEFSLFEHGRIRLLNGTLCDPRNYSNVCENELKRLKAYADLASKIWAGMAALFATTVALSKLVDSPQQPRTERNVPAGTSDEEG